ncbi:MAG: hypothetical protein IT317_13470 [Anaerolineales bacterium]|nr:hypothetical protein [Anaerolineales bacterium]
MPPEPPLPYQHPQNLIGRGGPAAGSLLSLSGSALAIIGFLLPWVSCANKPLTGLELAQQTGPAGESLGWVYVTPFLALGCFGVALTMIPLAAWRRVPVWAGAAAAALLGLLALGAVVPLVVIYRGLTTAGDEIGAAFGIGGALLKLEDGFWLTAVGLLAALMGAGLALLTSVIGALWPRAGKKRDREKG